MHACAWGRNNLFYYSNTLEVTREDQMKEKKNYFGKPYTQGVKERPREVESDQLRLCIIKSIISVTICD